MLFAIHNLASAKIFKADPWDYETRVPDAAKLDKDRFVKWCQKPTTRNCHFSAAEGLDPLRRVSKDNPAVYLHGLVADYDAEVTSEMLRSLTENCPTEFVPSWGSRTFSGGGRLVWLFAEPLTLSTPAVVKNFLKVAAKKLKLVKLLPGFDEDAFYDSSRYYEKGREWKDLTNELIPSNFTHQWMYEAGDKAKWISDGMTIPMETVAAEIQRLFPNKWKGPFEEGARGIRFWDADADNDTAAVVRASGMQCFTGDEGFLPWSRLLGHDFVKKYEADRTGEIIASLFYDGKFYWMADATGSWVPRPKEDIRLMLKVKYGLNSFAGKKETSSELERVIFAIQEQKSVAGAMPFVHFPAGSMFYGGLRYLNISSLKVLPPADKSGAWGENFPWLADFLDRFFDPEEQKDYFLAWWKHFYTYALAQKPRLGQAIFIAGDPGVGKTLLSTGIISHTVGGHIDASAYLLGEEKFTSHIVASPIMSVDDTVPASDSRKHTRYSAMIKKVAASNHQLYEEKFHKAGQVLWLGRVVVTCNTDPESVGLLPNLDLSLLDKVSLFRCASSARKFPDMETLRSIFTSELPHFCRWMLNWDVPKHCVGDSRFGVRSYHEKHLSTSALQTSASFSFLELLLDFLEDYRGARVEFDQPYWEGTATQLLADMMVDARLGGLATRYSPNQIATYLGQLKSRGYELEREHDAKKRSWRIPFTIINTTVEEKGDLKQRLQEARG